MLSKLIWLSLSRETRQKIAILLEIPKTGGVEVVDGKVISDGYTDRDLQSITTGKLQEFMGSTEPDFYKLFNQLVINIELPMVELKAPEIIEEKVKPTPEKIDKLIDLLIEQGEAKRTLEVVDKTPNAEELKEEKEAEKVIEKVIKQVRDKKSKKLK